MTERIWQPVPDEPCGNTAPHLPHRNWRGAECGVCPGVPAAKARREEPGLMTAFPDLHGAGSGDCGTASYEDGFTDEFGADLTRLEAFYRLHGFAPVDPAHRPSEHTWQRPRMSKASSV